MCSVRDPERECICHGMRCFPRPEMVQRLDGNATSPGRAPRWHLSCHRRPQSGRLSNFECKIFSLGTFEAHSDRRAASQGNRGCKRYAEVDWSLEFRRCCVARKKPLCGAKDRKRFAGGDCAPEYPVILERAMSSEPRGIPESATERTSVQ